MSVKRFLVLTILIISIFITSSLKYKKISYIIPLNDIESVSMPLNIIENGADAYEVYYKNIVEGRYYIGNSMHTRDLNFRIIVKSKNGDIERFDRYSNCIVHYYNDKFIDTYKVADSRACMEFFDLLQR